MSELLTDDEWKTIAVRRSRCQECGHLWLFHRPPHDNICLVMGCECIGTTEEVSYA